MYFLRSRQAFFEKKIIEITPSETNYLKLLDSYKKILYLLLREKNVN